MEQEINNLKDKLKESDRKLKSASDKNDEQHATSVKLLKDQADKLEKKENEVKRLKGELDALKKKKVVKEVVLPKGLGSILATLESGCKKLRTFMKKHEVGGKKMTDEQTEAAISAMSTLIAAEKGAYPVNFDDLRLKEQYGFGKQADGYEVLPPQPQFTPMPGQGEIEIESAEVVINGEVSLKS
jgi:hypothetical protein